MIRLRQYVFTEIIHLIEFLYTLLIIYDASNSLKPVVRLSGKITFGPKGPFWWSQWLQASAGAIKKPPAQIQCSCRQKIQNLLRQKYKSAHATNMTYVNQEIFNDKLKMEEKGSIKRVSSTRKWISLAILFFVNILNYMDRYTVSAILDVSSSLSSLFRNLDVWRSFIFVHFELGPIAWYRNDKTQAMF